MKNTITLKQAAIAILLCFFSAFIIAVLMESSFTENLINPGTHTFLKNVFFVNITFMGDAVFGFCVATALIILFNKKKDGLALLFAITVTLIIVQVIKNIFYTGNVPQLFFEKSTYFFDDEEGILRPVISLHTAIAFTLALFFSIKIKNTGIKILIFAMAVFIAYTRLYLAVENMWTITAGVLPAIVSVWLTAAITAQRNRKWRLGKIIKSKDNSNIYPGSRFIIFPEA